MGSGLRVVEIPSYTDRAVLHIRETRSLQLEGFQSDMRRNLPKVLGSIRGGGQESDTRWGALAAVFKAQGSVASDIVLWAPTG